MLCRTRPVRRSILMSGRHFTQRAQQLVADDGGMLAPFFSNWIRGVNVRLQGVPEMANWGEFPYHEFRIVEP